MPTTVLRVTAVSTATEVPSLIKATYDVVILSDDGTERCVAVAQESSVHVDELLAEEFSALLRRLGNRMEHAVGLVALEKPATPVEEVVDEEEEL